MKKKLLSVLMAITMLGSAVVFDADATVPFSINAEAVEYEKLPKPASLKATVNDKKVKLSWKKVEGAEAYGVYKYNASKKKYVKVKNVTGTKITMTVDKIGTYKYRVYALDKVDGKYKKGNYAYKKVTVKGNALDQAFKGLKWGMSKDNVLEKIGEGYFSHGEVVLKPTTDGEFFCYQFEDNKLTSYGVAYEYSDEKFEKLRKLFDNDDWDCLTQNVTELTKEDLTFNTLLYMNDEAVAGVMHVTESDLMMALVVKR